MTKCAEQAFPSRRRRNGREGNKADFFFPFFFGLSDCKAGGDQGGPRCSIREVRKRVTESSEGRRAPRVRSGRCWLAPASQEGASGEIHQRALVGLGLTRHRTDGLQDEAQFSSSSRSTGTRGEEVRVVVVGENEEGRTWPGRPSGTGRVAAYCASCCEQSCSVSWY